MRNILTIAGAALGMSLVAGPAFAAIAIPEPVSMSLVAGGVVAIAAVTALRRKK
jgi:hypothetical protein